VRFSEAELTVAVTGLAKATLVAQSKDLRKGRVDVEDAWRELGGYGRYQLLESIGSQILPVLVSLPDVPRVEGERPSFSSRQIRAAVEEHIPDDGGGRIRRKALVIARAALVANVLEQLPPWTEASS